METVLWGDISCHNAGQEWSYMETLLSGDISCHSARQEWSDMETVLWGGISGSLAGFTTTPFDVVKTRIMTSRVAADTRDMKTVLGSILKEQGLRGLFAGAGPRAAWWFAVCSVFFATFERVRTHIHDKQV